MKKRLCCLGVFFVLNACSLYQKPEVPAVSTPKAYKYSLVSTSHFKNNWWENFNDAELNQLINLALKNNYDYLIALKNINIAQTYVAQNAAYLYPQVSVNYNASRNKNSLNSSNNYFNNSAVTGVSSVGTAGSNTTALGNTNAFTAQQAFLSTSYELDVWHQVANTVNQAEANVAATEAQSHVIKLILLSNVVNTYFQINAADVNLFNLKQQQSAAFNLVQLYQAQYRTGLIDITTLDNAKNQLEGINADINQLQKQREILVNSLAYLVGAYPENFQYQGHYSLGQQNLAVLVPKNLPSQMLNMRPDIQESYAQVLSFGYGEKINLANFFPSFSLTGNLGYASSSLVNFVAGDNLFWNFGTGISQYLLDFGLRKSMYQAAKLQYQTAVLHYKDTVVHAFTEVDDALVAYQKDQLALHADRNHYQNTHEQLLSAYAQYQGGLADYSTYLNSRLSLLQSSYTLTNQQLATVLDVVQIYQTLGLGLN
jgi:multidrug efflux system outer membrane protein